MQTEQPAIPLFVAKLIVGFFSNTNSESELDSLDDWINADDANQELFEEFVNITNRPRRPDPDTEDGAEILYIVDLFIKQLNQTIAEDEKLMLDAWMNFSERTKSIFNEIPQTSDMEVVYWWLVKRVRDEHDRMRLN